MHKRDAVGIYKTLPAGLQRLSVLGLHGRGRVRLSTLGTPTCVSSCDVSFVIRYQNNFPEQGWKLHVREIFLL